MLLAQLIWVICHIFRNDLSSYASISSVLHIIGSDDDDLLTLDLRSLDTSALSTLPLTFYVSYDGHGQTSSDGDGIRIIGYNHDRADSTQVLVPSATDAPGKTSVVYQPSSHTFGDGRLIIHAYGYGHEDNGTYNGNGGDINIIVDFKNLEPVIY